MASTTLDLSLAEFSQKLPNSLPLAWEKNGLVARSKAQIPFVLHENGTCFWSCAETEVEGEDECVRLQTATRREAKITLVVGGAVPDNLTPVALDTSDFCAVCCTMISRPRQDMSGGTDAGRFFVPESGRCRDCRPNSSPRWTIDQLWIQVVPSVFQWFAKPPPRFSRSRPTEPPPWRPERETAVIRSQPPTAAAAPVPSPSPPSPLATLVHPPSLFLRLALELQPLAATVAGHSLFLDTPDLSSF